MNIKFCSSVILVKDVLKSKEFYQGLLKQEVEADYGENIMFTSGLSIWQIDYAHKSISKDINDCVFGKNGRFELYFESDDIDETYKLLKQSNAQFLHELIEQSWGQKAFRIYDPDEHIIEVGEPMLLSAKRLLSSGFTPEQVAKRTSIPIETITSLI